MEKNNNLSLGADMWKGSDIYDSFSDDTLQKAKELPDGSKSNHGGQPVVKQNGKWVPDTEGKSPKKEDTGDKEGSKSDDQSSAFTVGDTVKISAGIQSDPAGMKGQTVEVTKIDGDILHVKNSEGKTGMYMDNTASKVESEGKTKDEKNTGDTEVTPDSINKELDSKKTTGSLTGQEVRKIISNSLPYSKDEMRDLKFTKASFDKEKRVEQIFITDYMSKEPESTGRYLEHELGSTEFLQKIQDTLPSGWKIAVPDKVADSKGEYFGRGGKLHQIKVVNTNHPDYQSEGMSGYGSTENFTKFVDGTEIASKKTKDNKSLGDKIEEVLEFDPNATDKQIADQLNISEKEIKEYLEGEDDKEYDKFVKKKEAESAKREEEKSKGFSHGDKVSFTVDGKSIEGEVTASFKDERTVDVKGTDGKKYSSIDYTDLTKKSQHEKTSKTQDKLVEGDSVSYQKTKGAGNKIPFKGEIVSVDKDGKYAQVRNSIGDIDYVPVSDLKKK